MNESELEEFMTWYETQKDVFNNRRADSIMSGWRHSATPGVSAFPRDFMEVATLDVFLESCTIASACNSVS